jgi:hypothetical protein
VVGLRESRRVGVLEAQWWYNLSFVLCFCFVEEIKVGKWLKIVGEGWRKWGNNLAR